jgi:predicted HAD superfamily Cof-like phosphohydrolase/3'-phosphoadenosine 5'-phosphosulfate sulfotransferase (PAPS reductase)/FAD synthetase
VKSARSQPGCVPAATTPAAELPAPVNPYLITGPALISFSGGRTSAYMLYQIIQAHGGALPADVVVAFANTGKEREETLRFVEECAVHFGVFIHWVEFVAATGPHHERFEQVNFHTASRSGEPFERLIALRGRLPNPLQRFCSRELKVEPIKALCQSLGWERWTNVIGLRHDEGHRALKKYAENDKGGHRWKSALPLDKARVTKRDVMAFWTARNFDLQLQPHEGNCDLCFLKSRGKLQAIADTSERSDLAREAQPKGPNHMTEEVKVKASCTDLSAHASKDEAATDTPSNLDLVRAFHTAFDIPILPAPTFPAPDRIAMRLRILDEERQELTDAIEAGDLVEVADALTDMSYLVYGTALEFGIDLNPCFREVHRSNMSKLGHDGKPILRADGKVMKGPNYSRPNLAPLLSSGAPNPQSEAKPSAGNPARDEPLPPLNPDRVMK